MAQDPRKFLQDARCPEPLKQQQKGGFFSGLGKIGDLEVLNEVNNDIGQGLRSLETISNQVRNGLGVPDIYSPDSEASSELGGIAVQEEMNLDTSALPTLAAFNPQVVNRAQGQAEAIYDRVKQGNFEIRDVPEALQDFGNLGQLIKGIWTPPDANEKEHQCQPSAYARDLIAMAPKHKFMFVVQFTFTKPYVTAFSSDFAFVVKRTTRPQVQFEYEDVNYYNFKTKAIKRSMYQDMTMTFYDDMLDNVLDFYNKYLQVISPISNLNTVGDGKSQLYEEAGMTFEPVNGGPNSASIRNVDYGDPNVKDIIDFITIYHIVEGGKRVDEYIFDNPRIVDMQLDELDMADSSGNEMTINFGYDALAIKHRQPIQDYKTTLEAAGARGVYPISPRLGQFEDPVGAVVPNVDATIEGSNVDTGALDSAIDQATNAASAIGGVPPRTVFS